MWATFCNATENWRQSMKSKTKTILIFAAILAAAFLIAFLDGGAVQSAPVAAITAVIHGR